MASRGDAWGCMCGQARLQLVPSSAALPKTKGRPAGPTISLPRCLLLLVMQPSPLLSSSPPPLQEVTSQPVMGFDPLPPLDSIVSYTRPERYLHHPSFLRCHSHRVPSTPSPPGLGACGCSELMSSILEEEQPGLQCSPTGRMYRQDWSCCFSLVVTVGGSSCSQPLRQRPLKNFGCFLTEVVWGKDRFKRSQPWCAQIIEVTPIRFLCTDPAQSKPGSATNGCFAQRLASCWLPGVRNPQEPPSTLLWGWLRRAHVLSSISALPQLQREVEYQVVPLTML